MYHQSVLYVRLLGFLLTDLEISFLLDLYKLQKNRKAFTSSDDAWVTVTTLSKWSSNKDLFFHLTSPQFILAFSLFTLKKSLTQSIQRLQFISNETMASIAAWIISILCYSRFVLFLCEESAFDYGRFTINEGWYKKFDMEDLPFSRLKVI